MKFEYKTIYITGGIESLTNALNVEGEYRWECYFIQYKNEGLLGTYIAFLKRNK